MSTRKHVYTDPDFTPGGKPILPAAVDETVAMEMPLRWNKVSERYEGGPAYPAIGALIPPEQNFGQYGYVVGGCGHRVAGSEWLAGLRNCERCGG